MESRPTTGLTATQVQALIAASGYTTVPATSTSTGNPGQYAANATYLFICIAPNSWRRVVLDTF